MSDDIPTRVRIEPSPANGLLKTSWIATEKIMAVPVNALKNKVGQLSKSDMQKVSESLRKGGCKIFCVQAIIALP